MDLGVDLGVDLDVDTDFNLGIVAAWQGHAAAVTYICIAIILWLIQRKAWHGSQPQQSTQVTLAAVCNRGARFLLLVTDVHTFCCL